MMHLDYNDQHREFRVKFNLREHAWGEFDVVIEHFKKLYFHYEPSGRYWTFARTRGREFIHWCKKRHWECSVSANAQQVLDRAHELHPRKTRFFRGEQFDIAVLKAGVKPYEFQLEDIQWMVSRSRCYNANDPGLGKTFETIATISHWYKKGLIDSVFFLVKNGLSYHWKKEILEFSAVFKESDIHILSNEDKERAFTKFKDKAILILPNHLVADVYASYRSDQGKKKGKRMSRRNMRWSTPNFSIKESWRKDKPAIVLDEAHEFRHSDTAKYKSLMSQLDEFDFRIECSATPAINSFEDWYTQMAIIDEGILGMTEYEFLLYISTNIGDKYSPYRIQEYDPEKVEEVKQKIRHYVTKKIKADLPEMKAKQIVRPIYFEMTPAQKHLYELIWQWRGLTKQEIDGDKITLKNIFVKFPYTVQVVENPCLLEGKIFTPAIAKLIDKWSFGQDPRLTYLDGLLKEHIEEMNEKIVIFDTHPKTLNQLAERYAHYNPLVIHGETEDDEAARNHKEELFNDLGSPHKIFLLSALTSSAGINLQKGSNRVIFFTQPSDSLLFRQAMERTHRITSERDTIVEVLVLDKTFDVLRLERNLNRVEFNDTFLNKPLTLDEIEHLLNGEGTKEAA